MWHQKGRLSSVHESWWAMGVIVAPGTMWCISREVAKLFGTLCVDSNDPFAKFPFSKKTDFWRARAEERGAERIKGV